MRYKNNNFVNAMIYLYILRQLLVFRFTKLNIFKPVVASKSCPLVKIKHLKQRFCIEIGIY